MTIYGCHGCDFTGYLAYGNGWIICAYCEPEDHALAIAAIYAVADA